MTHKTEGDGEYMKGDTKAQNNYRKVPHKGRKNQLSKNIWVENEFKKLKITLRI